jgi:hypothetical protein
MSKRVRIGGRTAVVFLLALSAILFGAGRAPAQDVSVPVELQFPLFAKLLAFDRNLLARAGDDVVIGIVYQGRFASSVSAKDGMLREIENNRDAKVGQLPIKAALIDIEKSNLAESLGELGVDIVYIAPLRAVEIGAITAVTRTLGLVSVSGVENYAYEGVSVAIGVKADKPEIVINIAAAKAEGADFSSKLLQLSRIVQ